MGLSRQYRPRQPQTTALYQILSEHLEHFLAEAAEHERAVSEFVVEELRGFLTCGDLRQGFALARCGHCDGERLVPFSCGGRGFCPSCMGRRMSDTAARLVDQVLPHVPIRQWVLSLPPALRYLLAYDPELCTEVLGIFTREISCWLERTARAECDIPEGGSVFTGALSAIQRADSACKLNLHFHTLALDGVYVLAAQGGSGDSDSLRFLATRAPSKAEVHAVAWSVCQGTMALLKSRGLGLDASPEDLDLTQGSLLTDPMLSECAAASMQGLVLLGPRAGRQVLRLGTGPSDRDPRGRAAHGFDLDASRRVSAHDRKALERLCRYILRPPLSHDRVELTERGGPAPAKAGVRLRLKRPWSDGTTHLVFSPKDFIARLVPLVPPPKTHRVRYHGVLASHHRLRSRIVPEPPADTETKQLDLYRPAREQLARAPKHRIEWSKLMARTLGIDPLVCPTCERPMRVVGFVTRPASIRAHLRWRGLDAGLPPPYQPRGPPQLELPFPQRAAAA